MLSLFKPNMLNKSKGKHNTTKINIFIDILLKIKLIKQKTKTDQKC